MSVGFLAISKPFQSKVNFLNLFQFPQLPCESGRSSIMIVMVCRALRLIQMLICIYKRYPQDHVCHSAILIFSHFDFFRNYTQYAICLKIRRSLNTQRMPQGPCMIIQKCSMLYHCRSWVKPDTRTYRHARHTLIIIQTLSLKQVHIVNRNEEGRVGQRRAQSAL